VTDLASIKRLTATGREIVTSDSDMSPDTAVELVRIFDGIDRAIGDVSSE
jgi:hypothetical protein